MRSGSCLPTVWTHDLCVCVGGGLLWYDGNFRTLSLCVCVRVCVCVCMCVFACACAVCAIMHVRVVHIID